MNKIYRIIGNFGNEGSSSKWLNNQSFRAEVIFEEETGLIQGITGDNVDEYDEDARLIIGVKSESFLGFKELFPGQKSRDCFVNNIGSNIKFEGNWYDAHHDNYGGYADISLYPYACYDTRQAKRIKYFMARWLNDVDIDTLSYVREMLDKPNILVNKYNFMKSFQPVFNQIVETTEQSKYNVKQYALKK